MKPTFRLLEQWLLGRNVSVEGSEEKPTLTRFGRFCPLEGGVKQETGRGGAY